MPFTPSSQTRAPAMTSPDPAVIRALAAALVQRPRSNLADLARSAGISRATLYRMAPTRDEIIELLTAEGLRMMEAALSRGENEPAGPRAALDAMTALMLENRDLFLFVFNLFGEAGGPQDDATTCHPNGAPWKIASTPSSCAARDSANSASNSPPPGSAISIGPAFTAPPMPLRVDAWHRRVLRGRS